PTREAPACRSDHAVARAYGGVACPPSYRPHGPAGVPAPVPPPHSPPASPASSPPSPHPHRPPRRPGPHPRPPIPSPATTTSPSTGPAACAHPTTKRAENSSRPEPAVPTSPFPWTTTNRTGAPSP